jgi:hypothetical protein
MADLPRCAVCRTGIQAGQNVVFRVDGRAQHSPCPEVACQACGKPIQPTDPIRRIDEHHLIHANCWMKAHRVQILKNRHSDTGQLICSGCGLVIRTNDAVEYQEGYAIHVKCRGSDRR